MSRRNASNWLEFKQRSGFNLKDFGAVGDGTTDDTAAVQAFFSALTNNSYGVIPAGTYKVTQPLTLSNLENVELAGVGMPTIVYAGTVGQDLLTLTSCSYTTFRDIVLEGDGQATGGSTCTLSSCSRVRFYNCLLWNAGKYCLNITNTSIWVGAYDTTFNKQNTTAGGAVYHGSQSNNVVYNHCRFDASNSLSICQIAGGGSINFIGCDITGLDGTTIGLDIQQSSAKVNAQGCWFEGNVTHVRIGNTAYIAGTTIANNYFHLSVANGVGINVVDAAYLDILGNYFTADNGTNSTAIQVQNNTNNQYINIDAQNYFYNCTTNVSYSNLQASYSPNQTVYGTAAPTSGTWKKGDRVINSSPSNNANQGWFCTNSGSPGTWVPFGVGVYQSASAAAIASTGSVYTPGTTIVRLAPTAAVTGIIMDAGTFVGQEVWVINESGYSITFAASGSNVSGGSNIVIAANSASKFIWDSAVSLWFKAS